MLGILTQSPLCLMVLWSTLVDIDEEEGQCQ